MHKKCSVCEEAAAQYLIKDTTDYYCEECALDCFGDLGMLVSVEQQAHKLKEMIDATLENNEKNNEENNQGNNDLNESNDHQDQDTHDQSTQDESKDDMLDSSENN